jgi:8-amino-7-oxononanoate synthase
MADFTDALFLGYRHPSAALPSWASLTTGRPSAMCEPEAASRLAKRIAHRQESEAGVVHRSAFHALWDVIDLVARRPGWIVVLDGAAYPISRWAAAGAVARGLPVRSFPHHGASALRHSLAGERRRVVILTDGWCPDCGQPAPLAELGEMAASRNGLLLVDDTLATGVLGAAPTVARPFGGGGGGTMRWLGASALAAVQVASLAKAYGAPLAVTTGPSSVVTPLRTHGSRWHSSPPSAADLAAAEIATRDEAENDARRQRLARLVLLLRDGLASLGLPVTGRPFPLVSVVPRDPSVARALYDWLVTCRIRSLLRQARCGDRLSVSFSLTASHRRADITHALEVMSRAPLAGWGQPS